MLKMAFIFRGVFIKKKPVRISEMHSILHDLDLLTGVKQEKLVHWQMIKERQYIDF